MEQLARMTSTSAHSVMHRTEDLQSHDTQKKKVRPAKSNYNCEHVDRAHYAKGMCTNCYHRGGR